MRLKQCYLVVVTRFNWASIRLWLILLMRAASRGEDAERKNCQTKTQVTSFIPPTSPRLFLCTHRKGFSAPLVHFWLHHCLLGLLSVLLICHCLIENLPWKLQKLRGNGCCSETQQLNLLGAISTRNWKGIGSEKVVGPMIKHKWS